MPSLQKIDLGTKGGGVDFPFAFRTAGLDRAAHLRIEGTPRHHPDARAHLFWRGKLLVVDGRPLEVPLDQVAPEECREAPIFVGLSSSGPRLAADLALWSPREDAETVGQFTDASLQGHPAFPGAHFAEVRGVMPGLTELEGECIATARALLGWHTTHRFCANCSAETLVESSGWVRKCPACGTQHFPRTDPVVIMAITRGDQLLLGRGTTWPDRMYSLLAGFVEPGETIEAAVRRETLEEAHIRVGKVGYVASQPWPFPMSLMFGCFGEALDTDITIDPNELADARWIGRDEVRRIVAGTHPDINAPRQGAIAQALISAWAAERLTTAVWG